VPFAFRNQEDFSLRGLLSLRDQVGSAWPRAGSALADRLFGEHSLLAEMIGDFGQLALVGRDGRQVVGLADEIEGSQGFPHLLTAGIHGSDLGADTDILSGLNK
jgi:hypothetical protein